MPSATEIPQLITCECCSLSDDFVLETMSVRLNYDIIGDYETKYPFKNSGCGCEYEFALPDDCEYRHRYRYQKVSTTGTSADVWDGSDGTYNVGGTASSEVDEGSLEVKEDEPTYFTCACEEDKGVCIRTCTGNIYLGERHISERTVTVSSSVDITEVPCPNENGCVVDSYDPCENLYTYPNPLYNCNSRPERCGVVTQGKCVAQYAYQENDGDNDDLFQTVTQTFSGEVDMWDLPWDTGFEKLEAINYSNVWDDTKDCNNVTIASSAITDFNLYSEAGKTLYAFDTINTGLPSPTYVFTCGITPSVSSQFEKHKLRWRFRTPCSCYIKIWVCRYEAKIISSAPPYGYDESSAIYELSLEDSSIESHVINIDPTKCFDQFKVCGNHDGWNFTSTEFELTTPDFEFPETDPTLPDQSIGLRRFKGISLAGISFAEGWEPPLFEYDEEVWKSKCPLGSVISPYWYPTPLININLNPDPDPTKFEINLPNGLTWRLDPEVLQNVTTYFDTVINTIPAP
jgi:hypothetical protein